LPNRRRRSATSAGTAPCPSPHHRRSVESTFAIDRLQTTVTKGPGRAVGVAMAFKLIESAQQRWRMVNAPHLVALVRTGTTFVNGKLVERPDDQDQQRQERQVA
jgi:hypothetical protein